MQIAEAEIVDLLASLVDKSLAVYEEPANGAGRYRLLETVRQYAQEDLNRSDSEDGVRGRHLNFYVALAEKGWPETASPDESAWHDRMELEENNLVAALKWCGSAQDGSEKGLRLANFLHVFWWVRGHIDLGRSALEEALVGDDAAAPTPARGDALRAAGFLAIAQGDHIPARRLTEKAMEVQRRCGDEKGAASSLNQLGHLATIRGDVKVARAQLQEALAIGRRLDDQPIMNRAVFHLGLLALFEGDLTSTRSWLQKLVGPGNPPAAQLYLWACLAYAEGDLAAARSLQERSLAMRRDLRYKRGIAWSLCHLARIAVSEGNLPEARTQLCEGLRLLRDIRDSEGARHALHSAGILAAADRDYSCAAKLLSVVEAMVDAQSVVMMAHVRQEHNAVLGHVRKSLGAQALESACAEGRAMSFDEAVESTLHWLRGDSGDNSGNAA